MRKEKYAKQVFSCFHTQEAYYLILKLYFDISDEIIIIIKKIIIIREQLDIIILCLETIRFFSI